MSETDNTSIEAQIIINRENVSSLLTQGKFDEIGALPGFKIIENADLDPDNNPDCYKWSLKQEGGSVYTRLKRFSTEHHTVEDPIKGDFVIYFSKGKMTHMGKFSEEGKVISKFGKAHVYEHPIGVVPVSYLDKDNDIRFYRKNI